MRQPREVFECYSHAFFNALSQMLSIGYGLANPSRLEEVWLRHHTILSTSTSTTCPAPIPAPSARSLLSLWVFCLTRQVWLTILSMVFGASQHVEHARLGSYSAACYSVLVAR